jgi:sulfur relay (sulfurtransferase) complex TusBCD TusD component (DsrE family)
MGKLLLILFSPGAQSQNIDTVYELARTAAETGHKVTVFCDADATYSLVAKQIPSNETTDVADKIAYLIEHGVQVLACRESARLRGINTEKDFVQGVVESSLGGLTELMEQHDRIAAFGSSGK